MTMTHLERLWVLAELADVRFSRAMGGNRWQPVKTDAQRKALQDKIDADNAWREAYRAKQEPLPESASGIRTALYGGDS